MTVNPSDGRSRGRCVVLNLSYWYSVNSSIILYGEYWYDIWRPAWVLLSMCEQQRVSNADGTNHPKAHGDVSITIIHTSRSFESTSGWATTCHTSEYSHPCPQQPPLREGGLCRKVTTGQRTNEERIMLWRGNHGGYCREVTARTCLIVTRYWHRVL